MSASPELEALVLEVRRVAFSATRMREGYDMSVVDDLLDSLARALEEGREVGPIADAARIPTTRFRDGYDPAEVDHFLSWLVAEQSTGDFATTDPEEPAEAVTDPPEPLAPPLPTVIEEPPGMIAWLFGRR